MQTYRYKEIEVQHNFTCVHHIYQNSIHIHVCSALSAEIHLTYFHQDVRDVLCVYYLTLEYIKHSTLQAVSCYFTLEHLI